MVNHFKTEPVAVAASITTATRTLLACLILFGVLAWTPEQLAAVVLTVEAVLNVPLTVWARSAVSPVANHDSGA